MIHLYVLLYEFDCLVDYKKWSMLDKGQLYYLLKERLCFKEFVFLKFANKLRTSSPTAIIVLAFIIYFLPLSLSTYLLKTPFVTNMLLQDLDPMIEN